MLQGKALSGYRYPHCGKMTKKRGRLNLVDIIVIITMAIAVGWFVFTFVQGLGDTGNTKSITYVLETTKIRSELTSGVSEGDPVYDNETGKLMGKVASVAVSPAYHTGTDEDGVLVYTKIENYNDMYITIDASVSATKTGYIINDKYISSGSSYTMRTPSFYFDGECVSVKSAR